MRLGKIGIDSQSVFVIFDCLARVVLAEQGVAQIVMDLGIIGIDF